uniref:Uncharacterized protein n=1 Tax=Arion vulgaris TaxID=1028688 RepID=A0A0B6Z7K2_9EUPU
MNENGRTYERLEDDDNLSETDSSMVSHTQKEDESIISLSHKFPTLNFSNTTRSAHFTIKTAKGVMSHEVNHDILHACEIEASRVYTQSDFVQISLGHTCYYGDGLCCVYFDRPLLVKTLFSGYY